MLKKDFWYDLPKELIAQEPASPRDAARLMVLSQKDDSIQHRIFHDLPEYLEPGDLLVVNNSKVLPARIVGIKQPTGAVCELLLLRQVKGDQWECLAKPGKRMQPGSSIMPGKVNPVIPEVMNQVAYKVIGNDLCVAMSGEAAQMELNAMEPVMAQCCFESADLLMNGFDTLRTLCIDGITANEDKCRRDVHNSIGVVTALNPVIGYKHSTKIAKEALETGKGVYELVLEHDILSKEDLDTILEPENMIKPVKLDIHPNH